MDIFQVKQIKTCYLKCNQNISLSIISMFNKCSFSKTKIQTGVSFGKFVCWLPNYLQNNRYDQNYLIIVTIVPKLSLYDSHNEQPHNRYKKQKYPLSHENNINSSNNLLNPIGTRTSFRNNSYPSFI
jgi:hypothetical protein